MTNKMVFVHGRAQEGKDPDVLKQLWTDVLNEGLAKNNLSLPADLKIEMPFYGDKLDEFAKQVDVPLSEDIVAKGGVANNDYEKFRAQMLEEFRHRAKITDDQVDEEYGPNPKPKGPQNWEWVQAIIRAIDRHLSGVSSSTLELIIRDVYMYVTLPGVRDAIDDIVADALSEEPTVVIGHSLGTVVAYNVLRSDKRELNVSLYLTLGSPLAVRPIRDPLKPLKYPRPVGKWHNAYDERDVVALYPLDVTNFPLNPAITNDNSLKNSTDNRHGIDGYLDDADTAKRIFNAL